MTGVPAAGFDDRCRTKFETDPQRFFALVDDGKDPQALLREQIRECLNGFRHGTRAQLRHNSGSVFSDLCGHRDLPQGEVRAPP
jgi:hypothetical protein